MSAALTAYVVQHDYGRPLVVDFRYRSPLLDLSTTLTPGTPTVFNMISESSITPCIVRSATASILSVDPVEKIAVAQYLWRQPNTNGASALGDLGIAPGKYRAEFECTLNGGAMTLPTDTVLTVIVRADVA